MATVTEQPSMVARGRKRLMVRAQLPFAALAIIGFFSLHVAFVGTEGLFAIALWALGLAIFSAAAVYVPWERLPSGLAAIVPLVDVAVVVVLNSPDFGPTQAPSFLVIFPVVWLAYVLPLAWGLVAAAAAGAVVALVPWVAQGRVPEDAAGWFSTVSLPIATVALAAVVAINIGRRRDESQVWESIPDQIESSRTQAESTRTTLTSFAEAVNAAAIVLDPAGAVTFRNSAAARLDSLVRSSGGEEKLWLFRADGITPVERDGPAILEVLRGAPMGETTYWVGPPEVRRAMSVSSRKIRGIDNQFLGTMVVANDVTELLNAVSARDNFLTLMSHELNTPLTNIIGYSELISETGSGVEAEVAIIRRNAARLQRLISNLLVIGNGKFPSYQERADLSALMRDIAQAFEDRAERSGVQLITSIPDGVEAVVSVNQVREIVRNLLSNAFYASQRGGEVTLTLLEAPDRISVIVHDEGRGIEEDEIPRIFELFYRTKDARKLQLPGAGAGLYVASKYATAHNGAIHVDSSPGQGSTFTFELPR